MLDPTGASLGGSFRGLVACVAIVAGAANGYPGGDKFAQQAGKCAKAVVDAIDKRKKLAQAQAIIRAQLLAEK
jgi:hypothetical protein